jgi:formate dehydrogenase gamma subunit
MEYDVSPPENRVKRFSAGRIFEHWAHVLTFLALVATGLSQRFSALDFSQWFILLLGGIDNVRLVHRFTGIALSLGVLTHTGVAAYGLVRGKWQPTMVITKKDFADVALNVRYYLGFENSPARGGRYTYKQKFEYWGILTGLLLMMLTGWILWFPTAVTSFLPGELIPAAKVLHTNEALVVFLIISIWHVYNAIFSPEVFPLDTSILTGYISEERMHSEHPEELAGLEDPGPGPQASPLAKAKRNNTAAGAPKNMRPGP